MSFTSSNGNVLLSGIVLSDHRIEDLLTLFQKQEAEAERAACEARAAFNSLWDASCLAMDERQNRRAA